MIWKHFSGFSFFHLFYVRHQLTHNFLFCAKKMKSKKKKRKYTTERHFFKQILFVQFPILKYHLMLNTSLEKKKSYEIHSELSQKPLIELYFCVVYQKNLFLNDMMTLVVVGKRSKRKRLNFFSKGFWCENKLFWRHKRRYFGNLDRLVSIAIEITVKFYILSK